MQIEEISSIGGFIPQELWANDNALTYVAVAYALLWSIGKLLSRVRGPVLHSSSVRQPVTGNSDLGGLHVSGISYPLVEEFNTLADKKDMLQLAVNIAIHQPSVQEVGEIVRSAETLNEDLQMNLAQDSAFLGMAQSDSTSESLRTLNQDDLRSICIHYKQPRKLINQDFISMFGNLLFMENFIMYSHLSRSGHAVFNIPKDSELRQMFETFVTTGLAVHGRSIAIADRLHILNLQELQEMADQLGLQRVFDSVGEAAAALAANPHVSVRLAAKYSNKNLFLLRQESWDVDAVKQEWSAYEAYAKLFCTAVAANEPLSYSG